jgi:hypothetical protein
MASAPEAPNTEEWDAQAKASGVPIPSTTAAGGASAPAAAPYDPAKDPVVQTAAKTSPQIAQSLARTLPGSQQRQLMFANMMRLAGSTSDPESSRAWVKAMMDVDQKNADQFAKQAREPTSEELKHLPKVATGSKWMIENGTGKPFTISGGNEAATSPITDPEERAALGYGPLPGTVKPGQLQSNGQPFLPADATHLQKDNSGKISTIDKGGQTINIGEKAQSAGAIERAKLAAVREGALATQADAAPQNISRLKLLGAVLDKTETGPAAGFFSTVGGLAQSIGIDPKELPWIGIKADQATNADIAGKLAKELVLGSIGAKNGGFPASNFSNASREFIDKMFPNILNMPGANKAVQDVLIAREQAYQKMFGAWGDYQDQQEKAGNADPDYNKFERLYQREHADDNIFQPVIDKFQAGLYGPTGTGPPTANPQLKPQGTPAPVAAPIRIPAGMTPAQIKATYGGKGGVRIILPPTPGHPDGGEGFVP